MTKAPEPAVTADDIVFELERFEPADGRLRLSGRWFGVRGRRFVRPTLTLAIEGERIRALADLEDKPWAAEDGAPWTASFPANRSGRVEESELSVAPDITIQLPAPGARRGRSRRLSAVPRRDAMTASWGEFASTLEATSRDEAPEPETNGAAPEVTAEASAPEPEVVAPDPERLSSELQEVRDEVQRLLAQLAEANNAASTTQAELESARAKVASVESELAAARQQLESERAQARQQLEGRGGELETAQAELAATRTAREVALRNAAQAEAEREDTVTQAAQTAAERDQLRAETARLAAALEEAQATVTRLNREHDEAVTSRGAALVMRGATQALPAYERHVGWVRRGLAVLVLLGIVFAVLIVLGAL